MSSNVTEEQLRTRCPLGLDMSRVLVFKLQEMKTVDVRMCRPLLGSAPAPQDPA